MNFWSFLFGGSVAQTVTALGDAIDKNTTSDKEHGDQVLQDDAQARSFAPPGGQGAINDLINAVNRAIRPGVTIWLCAGAGGAWRLPPIEQLDPFWQQMLFLVLTFWFGGRMLTKDLPSMLAAIAELRAKAKR